MSHLDPAPMLEYIERLRTAKKQNNNDDNFTPEPKHEVKSESMHEPKSEPIHKSESEFSRTNEAAAKDSSEMSSPTPSPAQKSETSTFTVTLPAAQLVMCSKLMTLFKTSNISSARATAGSIRSISSARSARATAGSIRSFSEDLSSDDESDAAGEVWVSPKTGKEDQQRGEATTKNDEGSPSALTGNNTTTAAKFTRAASPIASEFGQYPSAATSSVVSGIPSPPVSRPNRFDRFDEGREAYLAGLAAAMTPAPLFSAAGRPSEPKSAFFITGSAPVGAKRHAVVYTRSEVMQIGREYRNVVLASLADCVGEKKLGLAVISAGKGGDLGLVSGS